MLTAKKIEALIKSGAAREEPDGTVRGLYFRSGPRTWILRYRHNRKTRNFFIGKWPEVSLALARNIAAKRQGEIAQGRDPAAEKQAANAAAKEPSNRDLIERVGEQFILRHIRSTMRPSWAHEAERMVRKEIMGPWKGRRLSEIARPDIHDLLDAIADRPAPVLAGKVFKTLRRLCGWAVDRGLIGHSPCEGIKRANAERSRDRVLSDEELRLVWQACGDEIGWPFGPLIQALILTGARRDEVSSMRWSELDFAAKVWVLPKERSKNKIAHQVPLAPQAMAIFERLPRIAWPVDFIFTTNGRTAVSGFSRAKARIDAKMGDAAHWTLHDLRRTAASGMARLGIGVPVIEKVLNHVSGSFRGVAGVYQRYHFETEKRAALDAWGRHVEALVSGNTGNVVELATA
jgi:integrase